MAISSDEPPYLHRQRCGESDLPESEQRGGCVHCAAICPATLLGPSHLHRDACSQVILAIFNYNDDDVPAAPAALINEAEEEV